MKPLYTFCVLAFLQFQSIAQNTNISGGAIFEGEPFIAVNPTNPQNITVAWMGFVAGSGTALTIRVRNSFDGGQTWGTRVNLPHQFPTFKSADVSMASDQSGSLYLSYIDYRESPDSGGVFVCKSVNGGLNWSTPVKAIDAYDDGTKRPLDRPWLVVNSTGSRLYLTTKPAPWVPAPNRPYFIASDDGGLTWKPWKYVDGVGFLTGNLIAAPMAAPALAGKETFHAVYPSFLASQSVFPRFIMASSFNYGTTFSYKEVYSGTTPLGNDSAKSAYKLMADPSDSNHLAFLFLSAALGDIDIMMTETFNAGTSWTTPVRINDDAPGNGKLQDLIWGDFNSKGDLIITWRDRRNAAGTGYNKASEIFYTYRPKDSSGFRVNKPLTDNIVAYNNILSQSGNDFMCNKLVNDTLYAVWGDTRDGSLDIWFAKVNMKTSVVTSIQLLESDNISINAYPNPFQNELRVSLRNHERIHSITIFNMAGAAVYQQNTKADNVLLQTQSLAPGIYIIQVQTKTKTFNRRLLKQ